METRSDDELRDLLTFRAPPVALQGLTISRLQFFGSMAFAAATALVTVTVAWQNLKTSTRTLEDHSNAKFMEYDTLRADRNAQLKALQVYNEANTLITTGLQNQVNSNNDRIKRVEGWHEKWDEKIVRMDLMREIGMANKESFLQEKGYPAPNFNSRTPTPAPK